MSAAVLVTNSWMRLLTGILAGFDLAWFAFPHVEASFA